MSAGTVSARPLQPVPMWDWLFPRNRTPPGPPPSPVPSLQLGPQTNPAAMGLPGMAAPNGVALGNRVVRTGGVADMEVLAGEVDVRAGKGWSWWWILIVLVILAIIGLIIWWIVLITMPRKAHDLSVRDLNARDIAATCNMTVAGLAILAGKTKLRNAIANTISLAPVDISDLNIFLDGSESCITLTNQSGSIVTVTLPSAADNRGLVIAIFNETNNAAFHVDPLGADTIEGSNATAVESSSALLISVGTTPSGLANWKQIM
jgi:hypothetical protein